MVIGEYANLVKILKSAAAILLYLGSVKQNYYDFRLLKYQSLLANTLVYRKCNFYHAHYDT